ncbi:isoleucine--tRNA ligase [Candidatus Babeliales bacterium]|nr:isoleucine--tRNA ligase [Candidatus Babeliales bacterium]
MAQTKVSYKDTLNLPRTDFPIRSNHKESDAQLLQRWDKEDLSRKTFDLNKGKKKFLLHDGPPYANGHIHLGHAYNKILKDMVAKSQRMSGKHVPVTPGWDCHGLPIELKVTQEHPNLDSQDLKKACRAYAKKWIDIQRHEFKQLGVLMDWVHPYETMDPRYEAAILRAFGSFVKQGYIEKKNKTVPWCASCETVLATAEIEYSDRKDPSIYVRFALTDDAIKNHLPELAGKPVSMLIWTTTPWTLPLNRAVFIRPKTTYQILEHDGVYFIVGAPCADAVCDTMGIEKKVVAEVPAEQLVNATLVHPFDTTRTVPVLADGFVSLDDGTACVHSAPGCGPEDYEMGVRYGLEIFSPLSPDGKYTSGIMPKELEGMSINDAQGWVIKALAGNGMLMYKGSIRHSYPHCWRCRNGLIFRATSQWFCDLSQGDLRERALKAIDTVTFIPERSKNFLKASVQNRLEWCLSRQRVWGVPIPALVHTQTGKAYIDAQLVERVAAGVYRHGIEYWDTVLIKDIFPDALREQGNTPDEYIKEQDILDVWFDSGVSHYAVLQDNPELGYPADMYLEGVDQHRGWFQSSLLTSLVLSNEPCYRSVVTHGFTVDEHGKKMSKSLGNVVAPDDIIKQLGTDGLRLWVSSISFEGDAIVSPTLLKNVQEVYRKVRNTCRFLLSNVYDFSHDHDAVPYDKMLPLDQYALDELARVNASLREAYDAYDFTAVFHILGEYSARSLSSFYLDIIKDRLYVEQAGGHKRRSAQTVVWHILDTLTHVIAPVLSFTSELISDHYQSNKLCSIHEQNFTEVPAMYRFDSKRQKQWELFHEFRAVVLKAIELKREEGVVKHSLDAKVTVHCDWSRKELAPLKQLFDSFGDAYMRSIKEWCIVSQLMFVDRAQGLKATVLSGVAVAVEHADGVKCPRCWQWDISLHEHGLCQRCEEVVSN